MKLAHSWLKATLSMMGTIMGAGLFALPAAFSYVGLWWGTLLFWILALGMLATHLAYARELLVADGKHRLAYFIGKRFGESASWIPAVTYPLHLLATNYAYLLLGGGFTVSVLFLFGINLSELGGILGFWLFFALVSIASLAWVARAEAYITAALVTSLLMLSALQIGSVTLEVTQATRLGWLLAFGVFLFSVSGFSGIGEVINIVNRKKAEAYSAVLAGTMMSAFLSWLFGLAFYLSSHGQIGERVIEFNSYVPVAFVWLLPVLGLSAIATSYITSSNDLRATFEGDWRFSKNSAIGLTYLLPMAMLVFFSREFVHVVSFIGAVFVGLNASMICLLGAAHGMPLSKHALWIKGVYGILAFIYLAFAIFTVYRAF